MEADGANLVNLSNNLADDRFPAWSPDGTKIAFHTKRDGNWEIYVVDADGANPTNLSNHEDTDTGPGW